MAALGKHRSPKSVTGVLQSSLQKQEFAQLTTILKIEVRTVIHGWSTMRLVEHVNAVTYPTKLFSVILQFQEPPYLTVTVSLLASRPGRRKRMVRKLRPGLEAMLLYDLQHRPGGELGKCFFGCNRKVDTLYNVLPKTTANLTEHTCGKANHTSTLCGWCKAGYSPLRLVYSYDMYCMNCTGMTLIQLDQMHCSCLHSINILLSLCGNSMDPIHG